MLIKFSVPVVDLDNKPIGSDPGTDEVLTLGSACVRALVASYDDEQRTITAEKKFKRGELASRIYKSDELEMKVEEVTLLKELVGKAYNPLVVFRIWPLLDAAESKGEK